MRYFRFFVLLSVGMALLVSACGGGGTGKGSSNVPAGDVALVKSEPITQQQLNEVLDQARANYKSQGRKFPKAGTTEYQQLVQSAVKFLVQRAEYEQKAKMLGVTVTDTQVESRLKQIKKQYFGGSEKKYRAALKKQ